jgi:hypothetical protein
MLTDREIKLEKGERWVGFQTWKDDKDATYYGFTFIIAKK